MFSRTVRILLVASVLASILLVPFEGIRTVGAICCSCTCHALDMRPDLSGVTTGNALQWGTQARAAGYPVDNQPRVGDIAVFQPGVLGAHTSLGHVAYVTAFHGNGTFDISETGYSYNWDPCIVHVRSNLPVQYGIEFIHSRSGGTAHFTQTERLMFLNMSPGVGQKAEFIVILRNDSGHTVRLADLMMEIKQGDRQINVHFTSQDGSMTFTSGQIKHMHGVMDSAFSGSKRWTIGMLKFKEQGGGWTDLINEMTWIVVGRANLLSHRPVTASSVEPNTDFTPEKAVDGNHWTRWSSEFSNNQWYQIDLGSNTNINRLLIRWETALAKDFRVEVKRAGGAWESVAYVTNNSGLTSWIVFPQKNVRYVRIKLIHRATPWGFSIWDVEGYSL